MRNFYVRARQAAAILPLFFIVSACDLAMVDHREKATEEWKQTYKLEAGGRLEIANVNGKVNVLRGEGTSVEVVAEKTARGPSPDAAREALKRIEITEEVSPSVVKVGTKLQRGGGLFNGGNLEVAYTVKVPAGVEVHLSTVNGGLDITGTEGKVRAEATNGGIKARDISGSLEASTTNGGVDVDLARMPSGGIKLETVNGGIQLRLPADAKASIVAEVVNGGIETTGLALDTQSATKRKVEGRLNGGGAHIDLQGVNGGIKIAAR